MAVICRTVPLGIEVSLLTRSHQGMYVFFRRPKGLCSKMDALSCGRGRDVVQGGIKEDEEDEIVRRGRRW